MVNYNQYDKSTVVSKTIKFLIGGGDGRTGDWESDKNISSDLVPLSKKKKVSDELSRISYDLLFIIQLECETDLRMLWKKWE